MGDASGTHILVWSIFIVSLALSAIFSAVETAFSALTAAQRQQLRQRRPQRGQCVDGLADASERLFNAILFGTVVANTAACVAAYMTAARHIDLLAMAVVFLCMVAALYLLGEVVPKSLAAQRAAGVAAVSAPWLRRWLRLVDPMLRAAELLAQWICAALTPRVWAKETGGATRPTEDEYSDLLEEAEKLGLVVGEERTMINRILSLSKKHVSDIMVPHADMLTVDDSMTPEELAAALKRIKHARVPVIHGSTDDIVGIINTREFLLNPDRELDEVIELPSFVPETMNVARLLQTFQRGGHKMAIAVDEYGDTAGVVTMEDLVEEIVGEIEDEFDVRELLIHQLDDHTWLLNGKARLDQINELLGTNLGLPGADTIGGWFLAQMGAFPKEGDRLKHENLVFMATRVGKNRVREILLDRAVASLPTAPAAPKPRPPRKRKAPRPAAPSSEEKPPQKPEQPQLPFDDGGAAC